MIFLRYMIRANVCQHLISKVMQRNSTPFKKKTLKTSEAVITCDQLVPRLQEIMAALNDDLNASKVQQQKERKLYEKQFHLQRDKVRQLSEENGRLREEICQQRQEIQQKNGVINALTSKNGQLKGELTRLSSIVHYLQERNHHISRQIFQLQMKGQQRNSARFSQDSDPWQYPQMMTEDIEISAINPVGFQHLRKEEQCTTQPYACSQRYTPTQDETVALHTPVKPIKLWEKVQGTPKSMKHSKRESVGKAKGTMTPLAKKGIKARGKGKQHLCHRSTGNALA